MIDYGRTDVYIQKIGQDQYYIDFSKDKLITIIDQRLLTELKKILKIKIFLILYIYGRNELCPCGSKDKYKMPWYLEVIH